MGWTNEEVIILRTAIETKLELPVIQRLLPNRSKKAITDKKHLLIKNETGIKKEKAQSIVKSKQENQDSEVEKGPPASWSREDTAILKRMIESNNKVINDKEGL